VYVLLSVGGGEKGAARRSRLPLILSLPGRWARDDTQWFNRDRGRQRSDGQRVSPAVPMRLRNDTEKAEKLHFPGPRGC